MRSVLFVLISLISIGFIAWFFLWHQKEDNPNYKVKYLEHTTSSKEKLPGIFLQEALELTVDNLPQLFGLDLETLEKKITRYSFVKSVTLKTQSPDTLHIEYSLKKPEALIEDWQEVAVDNKGVLFSTRYFYSPKKIPSIFLGLNTKPLDLHKNPYQLNGHDLKWVKKFIQSVPGLKRIDLSRSQQKSLGEKEIILTVDRKGEHYVRLPVRGWDEGLANYLKVVEQVEELWSLYDARLPKVIYTYKESK